MTTMVDVLAEFSTPTREWFTGAFPAATPAQLGAWKSIAAGNHTLVIAPTGSGKTLSAFLWAIDQLARGERAGEGTQVLYISPLKALAVDVERNLRSPLVGITQTAKRLGTEIPNITVGVRSGDTDAKSRRGLVRNPPDILITTPESLFLMLTSTARETLRSVRTVIVDEVHAVAGTKRGSHLALSLARLDALTATPGQRIGLSATVEPAEEVGRFLAGSAPFTIVRPPAPKTFDLTVRVPVPDMTDLDNPEGSIWPHVEEDIVELVTKHQSSIVFANSRRLSERLTARLNEVYTEAGGTDVLARAHHGSVSKEQRAIIEDDLKTGRLKCVVATSSLELGIDMGAVDLVVQVEAPPSVASGLQRVGRAGHQVGEVSRGVLFPKHRADVLHCAVTSMRMTAGKIEALAIPANPLDILAQHTVAAAALDELDADEWFDTVRSTGSFATLPRSAYDATLDLLSGKYPSSDFSELRPRLVWDRDKGTLTGRPGAQRLAVTSGGAIPDRGLFAVYLVGDSNGRIGELDEEMVYESRVSDVFALGATSWRIEEITHDRVLVSPAPGMPGRLPFWHGDGLGRPAELGAALGAYVRQDRADIESQAHEAGLDANAVSNLLALVDEQREATGHVPSDRTFVVERFKDELGDWRLILHSPLGLAVHAPWALAVGARLRDSMGIDMAPTASDDGIVVRLPDTSERPPGADLFLFAPDEIDSIVTEQVGASALFASRFRECAARALLLPRRDPGKRAPLWQQRQRASQLLDVARKYPDFPILHETVRECLKDVYDLPALISLMSRIEQRKVRVVEVETPTPSPYAKSLLFDYIGTFMYEGDNPLAERRAAALSLDTALLAELLGRVELRELLDPNVVAEVESQLQRLADDRKARDAEGVADLLRVLGPLTLAEVSDRSTEAPDLWLAELKRHKRVLEISYAGTIWWVPVEDASRLRDALGVAVPVGTPVAFLDPVADPLADLISRYARTHGPFTTNDVAARFSLGPAVVAPVLRRLTVEKRLVEGEFRPGAAGSEWCDSEVLKRLRRRSLAAARAEVEPVPPEALGRFLPAWQYVGESLRGVDGVAAVIEQLAGVPIPASALEPLVLSSRVRDYSPAMLDELMVSGEVVWSGSGSITDSDGWIKLHLADQVPITLGDPATIDLTETQAHIIETLSGGGGFFFRQLSDSMGMTDDHALVTALWELVWAGLVTGDTFAPVRAKMAGKAPTSHRQPIRRGTRIPRAALPTRTGPPSVAGRWSLLPAPEADNTRRAQSTAEILLERYGVLTKGAVMAEGVTGGFALMYRVLSEFEDRGRARRGYFVNGLGGAQFATSNAVDRLRGSESAGSVVLAAADPANPFGAALPWPQLEGHRPGRKAGSMVVLSNGSLVLYLERGGKTMLTFTEDTDQLLPAAAALVDLVKHRRLDKLVIERIDGVSAHESPLSSLLVEAGFSATPRGLRLRSM